MNCQIHLWSDSVKIVVVLILALPVSAGVSEAISHRLDAHHRDLQSAQINPNELLTIAAALTPAPAPQSGVTTTKLPDGTVIRKTAGGQTLTTRPDGSEFVTQSDGTTIERYKHRTVTTKPDGTAIHDWGDMTTTYYPPGGNVRWVHRWPDGHTSTDYSNGTTVIMDPTGKTTTIVGGTQTTKHPNGTTITKHPDRTTVTTYPEGTTVTVKPDGTRITKHYDGRTVTRLPNGTTTTAGGAPPAARVAPLQQNRPTTGTLQINPSPGKTPSLNLPPTSGGTP